MVIAIETLRLYRRANRDELIRKMLVEARSTYEPVHNVI